VQLRVIGVVRKGLKSIIILGAWMVWNHRNLCLFDSISPNLVGVLLLAFEVIFFWSLAGAQGISFLPLSL
jgi:hypothetical protein